MFKKTHILFSTTAFVAFFAVAFLAGTALAGDEENARPCVLNQCIDCGMDLCKMEKPFSVSHAGREARFCGKKCLELFKADPKGYFERLDQAVAKQQLAHYPLDTCPVSGGKLGSMGEPVNYLHENRLVRFCCKGCVPAFKKSPAKYLKKLDEAVIAQQSAQYPLETCPVSKMKLGKMGEPYNYVYANQLVRFCCKGCVSAFNKEPARYLAMVNGSWAKKHGAASGCGGSCSGSCNSAAQNKVQGDATGCCGSCGGTAQSKGHGDAKDCGGSCGGAAQNKGHGDAKGCGESCGGASKDTKGTVKTSGEGKCGGCGGDAKGVGAGSGSVNKDKPNPPPVPAKKISG
jgi:YHS domain-containing protein